LHSSSECRDYEGIERILNIKVVGALIRWLRSKCIDYLVNHPLNLKQAFLNVVKEKDRKINNRRQQTCVPAF